MPINKEIQKVARRAPKSLWKIVFSLLLVCLLLSIDWWCYQQTVVLKITLQHSQGSISIDDISHALPDVATPRSFQLDPANPVVHEYQIDGSDSTNNFSQDEDYFHSIASSSYYRFQAWMRNLEGTSRWRDLQIYANDQLIEQVDWPAHGMLTRLPVSSSLSIDLQLQRPETPRTFSLFLADDSQITVTLNRNDRFIRVTHIVPGRGETVLVSAFFPNNALPFLAMVLDTFVRTILWALLVLLLVSLSEGFLAGLVATWLRFSRRTNQPPLPEDKPVSLSNTDPTQTDRQTTAWYLFPLRVWQYLTAALHPIALIALVLSFCFVAWIARVQYQGQPHIFDANAYLFMAKTFALGRLTAPVPAVSESFPGPFMIMHEGRWFAQYPPGTALTLMPGIRLGAPWLVEPLLGTLALLGFGLLVAMLTSRSTATLAVILATLSPFYSYQAASYLSHTITLFYLLWGTWFLLTFLQKEALPRWNLPLAALCFAMAMLTRDLIGILYVLLFIAGCLFLYRRIVLTYWYRCQAPVTFAALIMMLSGGLLLGYNASTTGDPFQMPRLLFFAGDRWGFGEDIGFYGQHTLAAGLVNLDELLTILAIDLYGWPFYLTLAFLTLPFLLRRASAIDWFCLLCFLLIATLFTGYFYHGIYLGPRYLFETLPFLWLLTARGVLLLHEMGINAFKAGTSIFRSLYRLKPPVRDQQTHISGITLVLVCCLITCNLIYYLPRHIQLYTNYHGMGIERQVDTTAIYQSSLQNALVVTGDPYLYQMVLFPLNDPLLQGEIIYAKVNSVNDIAKLRASFPGRTIYHLQVDEDGRVHFTELSEQRASKQLHQRGTHHIYGSRLSGP